jgi:hypothetical protein
MFSIRIGFLLYLAALNCRTTSRSSCAGLTRASMMKLQQAKPYVCICSSLIMDCRVKPGNDPWRISVTA